MMKMETKNYVLWIYGVKKRTNSICQFEMQNFFKITKFSLLLNFFILTHSLRKKTSYSELFWSAFSPHFPAFGVNTERYSVSLGIQSECWKMREKCGPE